MYFWSNFSVVPDGYELVEKEDHRLARLKENRATYERLVEHYSAKLKETVDELKEIEGE